MVTLAMASETSNNALETLEDGLALAQPGQRYSKQNKSFSTSAFG